MNIIFVFLILLFVTSFKASVVPKVFSNKHNSEVRIIGGKTATAFQFPYAAAIYVETKTAKHFCSGTLLSDQWILTAGQCVDNAINFDIKLGSIHLNNADGSQVEVATSTHIQHPNYNPDTLENDIGLIKLRAPLTFSYTLKPIDLLPWVDATYSLLLFTFGWGQTSDDNAAFSNDLQWVNVLTLTNADCSKVYGDQIKDTMLCAEGNYNEGTCYGDIGSALIQYTGKGQAVLVGISSFVSFNGCESTDSSGFTRVYPYNDWIRNTTGLDI